MKIQSKKKLAGEAQVNALEIITFMRVNNFSFKGFYDGRETRWTPVYNDVGFGCIMVNKDDGFALWIGLIEFNDNGIIDDDMKESIWSFVVNCPQEKYCNPPYCKNCKNRWSIFGKEFESTCHAPLAFFNPDTKTVDNIKRLLLMIK